MIELNAVSKSYVGRKVLDNINLHFVDGKTHVLLGSSGSGKSTLLRLLMGLILPDQGEIQVTGLRVSAETQPELATRIGYVVQEGGLFPHLTTGENITLAARLRGWTNEKTTARLRELSELAGLDESMLQRFPRELSGGQRQRAGLLRALMLDPSLLLLDEPLGALDPLVRYGLQTELKRIFDSVKKTVFLVTHDVGEAAFFGHTITLLHEGRVVQQGTFRELAENPASDFVKEFLHAQRPPPEIREWK